MCRLRTCLKGSLRTKRLQVRAIPSTFFLCFLKAFLTFGAHVRATPSTFGVARTCAPKVRRRCYNSRPRRGNKSKICADRFVRVTEGVVFASPSLTFGAHVLGFPEGDANTTPSVRTYLAHLLPRRGRVARTRIPKGTQTQHVQIFFQSGALDL